MAGMQNVSFKNVNEFLDFLPENELNITEFLREIIFGCIPEITEKLSYNVPFYAGYKTMFFIWPAAVLWGKKKSYIGVRLGFTSGYLMQDAIHWLDKGDRKQVYYKDFTDIRNIEIALLKSYIFQAALIDAANKKDYSLKRKTV